MIGRKSMHCLWDIRAVALTAAVLATFGTATAAAQQFTMKIGTATPRGDQNTWMARFKERVEKRAAGRISIKLFPSSQLGAIPREIEGMQLGTVESWVGPPGFVKGVEPRYQVPDVPGIFRDKAHGHKTLTDPAFREVFLNLGKPKGVFGISVWVSNFTSVVTKSRPIRKLSDYRGLKLRVLASDMEVEALNRLGAAPTPMPLLEALPSLQRGAIDGVKAAMVIFVPFRYWTVAPHLTESHESLISIVSFVSRIWWDKLPRDLQAVMLEEGKKLEDEMFDWALDFNKGLRAAWLKNGGRIYQFPADERARMMARLGTVGETVVADKPAVKQVYDLMVKTSKRH